VTEPTLSDLAQSEARLRKFRMLKDRLFGLVMGVGGIAVIGAILAIFVYLLAVVIPLFRSAEVTPSASLRFEQTAASTRLALNEYADIAFALAVDGTYAFHDVADGRVLLHGSLVPSGRQLQATNDSTRSARTLALALDDGTAVVARPAYVETFENQRRVSKPSLAWPLGEVPVAVVPAGRAVTQIAAEAGDDGATIAALTNDGTLYLTSYTRAVSLLQLDGAFESTQVEAGKLPEGVAWLAIDIDQQELYAVSRTGHVHYFDIRDKAEPRLVQELQVLQPGEEVTAVEFLAGGVSLLIGDSSGRVSQWFPVRDEENNHRLTRVRRFEGFAAPVKIIVPEHFRKGFLAVDAQGALGIFHATAERTLLLEEGLLARQPALAAISPHADSLILVGAQGEVETFEVRNKHPEVSLKSLWGKVWYEGRAAPEYIWQSSSASSDFEPKFSLTPLTFGTIKAAVYAMLFAIPVAIFGAVYTAYFMQPRLRMVIKPSIEIMAALPTVILGFLAGLWLAPLIESHLIGVLLATALMPLAILVAAFVWSRLPGALRHRVPDGWEAIIIVPVVCAVLWATMALSQPVEQLFFGGNLPRWMAQEWGITYDQRNSLVVGIAMGFAVIPNIFSISEDAVFGVPRQLTTGSLALGATPWQTVTRVVLLTASPGIFSAIMIGLGRAVGETMIVLMSTGNTPIMDLNIFQGFRALSANIAVEMPESEVNSSHYRILFLAALVLFGVTFLFNTIAEIVRSRLRAKYGNL
jgi:phosphate transport system permease protein